MYRCTEELLFVLNVLVVKYGLLFDGHIVELF
jgi:hypothetical protein